MKTPSRPVLMQWQHQPQWGNPDLAYTVMGVIDAHLLSLIPDMSRGGVKKGEKGKEDSRLILKEERTVQLVYWNKLGRLKQQCLEDLLMAKLQGLRGLPLTWGYIIVQLWYQGGSSTLATVRLTAWCSPEWLYQRAPTHSFLGIWENLRWIFPEGRAVGKNLN